MPLIYLSVAPVVLEMAQAQMALQDLRQPLDPQMELPTVHQQRAMVLFPLVLGQLQTELPRPL